MCLTLSQVVFLSILLVARSLQGPHLDMSRESGRGKEFSEAVSLSAGPVADSTLDEEHSFMQSDVELRTNAFRVVKQTHSVSDFTRSMEQTSFIKALSMQSASFLGQMQALQQQAAVSANRTRWMLEELAAESAKSKAGPSHMFPHRHVVARCTTAGPFCHPRDRGGSSVKQPEGIGVADLQPSQAELALGSAGFGVTLLALALVVVMGFMTLSRKDAASDPLQTARIFLESAALAVDPAKKLPESSLLRATDPAKLRERVFRVEERSSEACCGRDRARLSVWDGTVATFSCVVGTGLLAMPYAFSLAGMVAVPVVIFFVCCSAFTAHLMAWALDAHAGEAERRGLSPGLRGWGFLAEIAFGPRAKGFINGFLIIELWGYLSSCTVCAAMNVMQIAEDLSVSGAVFISVAIAYALTFVPVRLLTKVNVLSNAVFVITMMMFLITGLLLPEKAPASEIQFVKPQGLVLAAGILVFSPAGHSFFPALMQRMEEPSKFPVCLRRGYAAACLLYLAVAVPGYYLFGNAVQPSAVGNIGVDLLLKPLPDLGWMNSLAAFGMVTKMLTMQTLVLTPLSSTVESVLGEFIRDTVRVHKLVPPCLLAVSAIVAVRFATKMAMLLNLIGSLFCMNIAFVVPVLCYWKLSTAPLGPARQIACIGLIVMGGTFAVLGVYTSL